jgi:hypothetical protein
VRISFHGGLCCGIKHIHEVGCNPNGKIGPKPARKFEGPDFTHDKQMNPDQWGINVSSADNAFYGEAPKETYLERLDRYLKFLDGWRPSGIVEIVLSDGDDDCYNQVKAWEELLLERGFKAVNSCKNSNSGNTIWVYHRNTEKDEDDD